MKPEGLLQHLQVHPTYPYPESDKSNPCQSIPIIEVPF